MEGVSVAKSRVAQRLGHLEKTRDQKSPTIVKTIMKHFLAPLKDQGGEGRVYIHKEQRIECGSQSPNCVILRWVVRPGGVACECGSRFPPVDWLVSAVASRSSILNDTQTKLVGSGL